MARTLLSLLVGLGFMLHQVCVPLHLSLHHHHGHDVTGLHVDPPAGHHHHGGDHLPHPAADHDGEHGDRALRPSLQFEAPLRPDSGPVVLVFDEPAGRAASPTAPIPPPSPPRSIRRARAPPVAV